MSRSAPPRENPPEAPTPMDVLLAKGTNGNGMGRRFRAHQIIALGLTVLIVAALGIYLYYNQTAWRALGRAGPGSLAILAALWALIIVVSGYKDFVLFRYFGARLRLVEWVGLPPVQVMSGYIIPFRGSVAITAVYLKRQYGLAYSKFVACYLAIYMVFLASTGPVACAVLGAMALGGGRWHPTLFGFFALFTVASWGGWALVPRLGRPLKLLGRITLSIHEGWVALSQNRGLMVQVALLMWAVTLLTGLLVHVAMRAVGEPCGLLDACITGILLRYSVLIKFLPGNLGVHEGLVAIISKMLGYSADMGLAAALLLRGVNLVLPFTLGPVFAYLLARRMAAGRASGAWGAQAPSEPADAPAPLAPAEPVPGGEARAS